jgi:protein SCO1
MDHSAFSEYLAIDREVALMTQTRRTALAISLVLIFGLILMSVGTDRFTTFTAEAARMKRLAKDKPVLPEVRFKDSNWREYSISEFKGKYVFITFVYTSCTSVCPLLEMNMAKVYSLIPSEYLGKEIMFLSISFDPARDDPVKMKEYGGHFNSDGETWRLATIPDQKELGSLLQAFGVIVIPDGYGNLAHNSAFYLVDRQGVLADVMDYRKPEEAAHKVLGFLNGNREGER